MLRNGRGERTGNSRYGSGRGRRVTAALLAGILTFEAAFGNGLSTAFADPMAGAQGETGATVQLLDGNDSTTSLDVASTSTEAEGPEDPRIEGQPWDWTGDTTRLVLASDGLTVDYDAASQLVEAANAEKDAEKDAESADEAGDQTDLLALLPERLPATIGLSFSLDASAEATEGSERADAPATLEPGDFFTVKMPDGVTLAAKDQTVDVFELDESGEPASVRVATAEAQEDGSLKVTLVERENFSIEQTDQAIDQTESIDQDESIDQTGHVGTLLRANAVLSVSVESDLFAEDDTELVWTLQTSSGNEADKQEATLVLPAITTLAKQLGVELSEVGNAEDGGASEDATDESSAGQPNAAPQVDGSFTPVEGIVTDATLTMNWFDNNDEGDKRPAADAVKKTLSLSFTLDNTGEPLPLTVENAEKYFGMSEEDLAALFSVDAAGVGTYTVTASKLYTQIEDSNGDTHGVTWTLSYEGSPDGYHRTEAEDGSLNFQLLATSTYTIVAKVGEEKLSTDSAPASDFVVIDASGNEVPLSAVNNQSGWTGVWDAESGTYKLTAPAYGLDGLPFEYGLTYAPEMPNPTPDDTYSVTYDNAASDNHGSTTTAVYDGGTATILRVGTTTFNATKQWLDANDKQGLRPDGEDTITFTLWRYTSNGDTAANAAQVTDTNGNFVTLTAKVEKVTTKDNVIDLGALLADQYPELTLEKYDNDGYAYYYGIREESSFAGYETVYGSVSADGETVTDTAPNYTNKKGEPVSKDGWERDTNVDRLIYNNGAIGNRLTGQTMVKGVKEWHVAAFADQLNGVSCTFTLQSRVKGEEDAAWESTENTLTLTDFTAETLTKEFSGSFDKHDMEGNELEYRWVETGVEQKYFGITHAHTNFTPGEEDENGHIFSTFTLFLRMLDEGNGEFGDLDEYEPFYFTSESWVDENGITRVRNTFDATVDEKLDKRWAEPGENGELVEADAPAHEITIVIYDGDVKLAEAAINGTADDKPTDLTLVDGVDEGIKDDFAQAKPTYQETEPDHLELNDLPLYKSDGSRYNYRLVEVSGPEGWNAQSSYDAEKHLTTIVNTPASGEGTEILLEKKWVDGGDASHRLAVEIGFWAEKDIYNSVGTKVYSAGEALNVLILDADGSLRQVNKVTITEGDTWFTTATVVGANDIPYESIRISENYLVATGEEDSGPIKYEVFTYEEAQDEYKGAAEVPSWVNTGWGYEEDGSGFDNAQYERVSTGEHVYEVTYGSESAEESPYDLPTYYVANRRIGLVNISIEKTWKDGNTQAAERPDAVYRVTCDDPDAAFFTDDKNQVSIRLLGGNKLPLFWEDPDLSGEAPSRLTGTVDTDENGRSTLLVKVPKAADEGQTSIITNICGLPKYDGQGVVVSYSVTEEWADGSVHDGYAYGLSTPTYSTGKWHFKDTCSYTATNSLVGTRDVTFYKEWNDAYIREGAGQRPDINLTLYRVSAAEGSTPERVTSYVNWRWEALEEDDAASQYKWKATAPSLAKYDANGYAYTYYAVENIPDAAARLDYQDVMFREDDLLNDWTAPKDVQLSDTVLWNLANAESPQAVENVTGDEKGSAYALREGGTFVNSLANTLNVNGRKIWQNIPGDIGQAKLPQILVLLQRRYVGEQDWPAAYIEKSETNGEGEWGPSDATVRDGGVIAWTDKLDESGATYNFTITHVGDNNPDNGATSEAEVPLPRYDADGRRYEYRAVEVVTGLIGTPALPEDKVNGVNVAASDSLDLAGDVYAAQHGEAGSFVLRNTYAPEKGNLTVKKIIEGQRATDDKFPDVTFTLYRYDPSDADKTPSKVDDVTIKSFESNDDGETGAATHTFKDLDVFTPNGEYWRYYVVEKAVNGYTTYVGTGDLSADTVKTEDSQSPDAMEGGATLVKANDEKVDITFKNTYTEDAALTLTGTKCWNDLDNAFGTRPGSLDITLTRHSAKQTDEETVKLQGNDANAEAYLMWDKSGGDTWTYTISNLEQWAPDGTAWTYTVTEKLADGNQAYRVITGSAQKQGSDPDKNGTYTGTLGTLENRLAGSASVKKSWEGDGNDEWGLRPESVTVELQARTSDNNGTSWGEWGNAETVLQDAAAGKDTGITAEQTLTGPNWSHSWDVLPYQLKNGTLIQYRVVETKVGDTAVDNATGDDLVVTYPCIESYTGKGETTLSTTQNDAGNNSFASTSATTVTNTLDATELTVKKVWEDNGDEWGLRDKVSGSSSWTATFYLQRSTDDGNTWRYVTKGNDDRVKAVTVTGAAGTDEGVKTFGSLPAFDESGNPYRYRAVEAVPGGYALVSTITAEGLDKGHATVSGDSSTSAATDEANQTFTNKLETITLSGEKSWDAFGVAGLVPGDANNDGTPDMVPTLKVERTAADDPSADNATWEDVTDIAGQPAWTRGEGSWSWTYNGSGNTSSLPKYDGNGNPYTYRVSEVAGSVPGFYPTYENGGTTTGPATVDSASGSQTASTITNVATRFTFDKVNESNQTVVDVELAVVKMGSDGKTPETVYAVWRRDGGGGETSFISPGGVSASEVWAGSDYTASRAIVDKLTSVDSPNAGDIIGLSSGSYTVVESGAVSTEISGGQSAQHVRISPFELTVSDGGEVSVADGSPSRVGVMDGVACVEVVDPIFRVHFEFTKVLDDVFTTHLSGVTFELKRVTSSNADGPEYETVATGLTTDENGHFSSENSGITTANLDAAHTKLSDGLVPGTYVLVETSAPDGVHFTSDPVAEFTVTMDDHGKTVAVGNNGVITNTSFSTVIELLKYDSDNSAPIEGAEFVLKYRKDDTQTWPGDGDLVTTDGRGMLTLSLTEKGQYQLTEVGNKGYKISDIELVFTVSDSNHGKQYTLAEALDAGVLTVFDGGKQLNKAEAAALLANGLPNDRLTGDVTLRKVDAKNNDQGIDGVTFKLQKQGDDVTTWTDVATNLVTGNTYTYAENDGTSAYVTTNDSGTPAGTLKVTNLPWGTYKFVETKAVDGYTQTGPDGSPFESAPFVISRNADTDNAQANATVTGGAISVTLTDIVNNKTTLTFRKAGQNGGLWAGATLLLEPAGENDHFNGTSAGAIALETEDDGSVDIDEGLLIAGNSYTVTEQSAPDGYEVYGGSFTFTVTKSGAITPAEGSEVVDFGEAGYSIADNGTTLVITDRPIDVVLSKRGTSSGGDSELLAGATFKITPQKADGAFMSGWLSANRLTQDVTDGSVLVNTAPSGEVDLTGGLVQNRVYTIQETSAPAGYELLIDPFTFRVEADGTITPGSFDENGDFAASTALPQGYAFAVGEDGLVTITATDVLAEVQILKTNEDGTPLAGAEFSVAPAVGSQFCEVGLKLLKAPVGVDGSITLATDEEGTIDLFGLFVPGDSYVITETKAPAGYKTIGPVTVKMGEDGSIAIVDENGDKLAEPYAPASGAGSYETVNTGETSVLIVKDEAYVVDLVKQDVGGTPLAGAELTIAPAAGYTFADGSTDPVTGTTDAEGRVTISGLVMVGGQYVVTESKAPAGYELNDGGLTFTVSSDGYISVVGTPDDGLEIGGDRKSVIVKNALIELGLEKADTLGNALSGATFKIKGIFANSGGQVEERSFTVGTDGLLKLPNMVGGETYTVTEVVAPVGYRLLTEPFEFTVLTDGTIDAEPTSEDEGAGSRTPGYYVTDDGLALVAVDERRPSVPSDPSGPDDPADPDDPTDPDEPVNPDEPTDPNEPVDPDEPTDPDTPDTPDNPDTPEVPDTPDTPGTTDEPGTPGRPADPVRPQTPDTGDHTNAAVPVALAIVGVLLAVGAVLLRRRSRK